MQSLLWLVLIYVIGFLMKKAAKKPEDVSPDNAKMNNADRAADAEPTKNSESEETNGAGHIFIDPDKFRSELKALGEEFKKAVEEGKKAGIRSHGSVRAEQEQRLRSKEELRNASGKMHGNRTKYQSKSNAFPKKTTSEPNTSINESARRNIAAQEAKQAKERVKNEQHELTMEEIIREKEAELRCQNHTDHQEIPEEKHLMRIVEDLMVKGPNTDIPNERDFLSEGQNMLKDLA